MKNIFFRWKESWLRLRLVQALQVMFIAGAMPFIGAALLHLGKYEDAGSGLIFSTQPPNQYSVIAGIVFVPASLIAWGILAPALNGRKIWTVLPVGILAPFLGSAGYIMGIFIFGGPIGLIPGSLFTYLAWTFIWSALAVMVPVSVVTAVLIWLLLNRRKQTSAIPSN